MAPLSNELRGLTVLTIALVVGILIFAKAILIPLSLAALFAFLLHDLVSYFGRRGLPKLVAVVVVQLLAVSMISALVLLAVTQSTELSSQSPQLTEGLSEKLVSLRDEAQQSFRAVEGFLRPRVNIAGIAPRGSTGTPPPSPTTRESFVAGAFAFAQSLGHAVMDIFTTGFLVALLSFFFLLHGEDLSGRILTLAGEGRLVATSAIISEASKGVRKFILLNLLVNLLFGFLFGTILFVFDIPQFVLWGIIASVLRFVPVIGVTLSVLPPILLAFALDDGNSTAVYLGISFGLLCTFILYAVEPLVYGRGIGVSALAIILSALFWTWCWGPVGLLLASPFTICLVVLGRYVPSLEWIAVLFGERRGSQSAYQLFHRLLNSDPGGADQIMSEHSKLVDSPELYDDLVVPVLNLAHEDMKRGTLAPERYQALVGRLESYVEKVSANKLDVGEIVTRSSTAVLVLRFSDPASALAANLMTTTFQKLGLQAECISQAGGSADIEAELSKQKKSILVIPHLSGSANRTTRAVVKKLVNLRRSGLPVILVHLGESDSSDPIRSMNFVYHASSVKQAIKLVEAAVTPSVRDAILQSSAMADGSKSL